MWYHFLSHCLTWRWIPSSRNFMWSFSMGLCTLISCSLKYNRYIGLGPLPMTPVNFSYLSKMTTIYKEQSHSKELDDGTSSYELRYFFKTLLLLFQHNSLSRSFSLSLSHLSVFNLSSFLKCVDRQIDGWIVRFLYKSKWLGYFWQWKIQDYFWRENGAHYKVR
jgi:hypothetical protein